MYGVVGYKTHAKLLLIVRRERTACAATATWVPATITPGTRAAYTDYGLFTCDEAIGDDVHETVPAADQPDAARRA